jgi:hypothetical protein
MKRAIYSVLAALALLPALPAAAWSYNEGDVLLIFRESQTPGTYPSPNYDVEFDLGSVTNFLGKTNGYTTTVSGWNLANLQAVYGTDLTGVSVILIAATSPTNASPTAYFSAALPQSFWLNGVEPYNTAYNVSPSVWQAAWSRINAIGTRPGLYLPANQQATSYAFPPSSVLSYDRIAASDGYVAAGSQNYVYADWLAQFGGWAPFTVETEIPGSFGFLAVAASTATPKPLDSYLGTFTIDAAGTLKFTAGPPAPVITGITRSGGVNTISFSTGISGNYSLVYTNTLGGSAGWTAASGSLVGDGNVNSLAHANAAGTGYYRVVRTP